MKTIAHIQRAKEALSKIKETKEIKAVKGNMSSSDLHKVKWIGPATVAYLYELGITDQNKLKTKTVEEIETIIDNPLTQKHIINFIRTNT